MITVVKSAGATVANGALQLVYQNAQGILTDVFAAGYQILDSTLTQVFPMSGTQAINTVTARAGLGRYNATWVSSAAAVGRYTVRWYLTPSSGDVERTFDQGLEVVLAPYRGPHYATVQDLRDEGLAVTVTDAQAQAAIVRASRYVEFFTQRSFGPTYRVLEIDGTGARALLFNEPIVAIDNIIITFDSVVEVTTQPTELSSLKIYNRHLTQGLVDPDDRANPKITFIGDVSWPNVRTMFGEGVLWPSGVRNIQVTGLFGYTEADGSYTGATPALVTEATKMLVFENLAPFATGGMETRGPITKERTRDQEVDYAALRVTGMTGVRAIDVLLAGFKRLPSFGSA